MLTGDLIHSPIQARYPELSARPDTDPAQAAATRRKFLECHCDTGRLVCTAHFPSPSIGPCHPLGRRFPLHADGWLMGRMVDGAWHADEASLPTRDGTFDRAESRFRDRIKPGGRFPPEAGRYHLYVSLACPWAHRTLIFRKLKGLEDLIGVSVVHP